MILIKTYFIYSNKSYFFLSQLICHLCAPSATTQFHILVVESSFSSSSLTFLSRISTSLASCLYLLCKAQVFDPFCFNINLSGQQMFCRATSFAFSRGAYAPLMLNQVHLSGYPVQSNLIYHDWSIHSFFVLDTVDHLPRRTMKRRYFVIIWKTYQSRTAWSDASPDLQLDSRCFTIFECLFRCPNYGLMKYRAANNQAFGDIIDCLFQQSREGRSKE